MAVGNRANIFFPIETINRELDYRLMLGSMVASKDNRIVFGQHDALSRLVPFVENGIYHGKHIFPQRFPREPMTRYRSFKERGFVVVHLDEEGGVYVGDEENWKRELERRLDVNCLEKEDRVLTWGDFQRTHFMGKHPKCTENVRTTGHPRFDLCKSQYRPYFVKEAEALRKRLGSFVLINSNLAFANNGQGLDHSFSKDCGFDPLDEDARRRTFGRYVHDAHALIGFVDLLQQLSLAFPDVCFVLRPHPSEDRSYYETMFGKIRNVKILHEGPIIPWLLATDLVLHDGCTTGIEAFLAQKPIVIYKPFEDDRGDLFLPNQFGLVCRTVNEVMATIRERKSLAETPVATTDHPMKEQLLANLERESFSLVADDIRQAEAQVASRKFTFDEARFRAAERIHQALWLGRGVVRHLFPKKMQRFRLVSSKFYGFDEQKISGRLDTIARMLGKRPTLRFINSELFILEG